VTRVSAVYALLSVSTPIIRWLLVQDISRDYLPFLCPGCTATPAGLTHEHTVPLGAQHSPVRTTAARARNIRNTRIGLQKLDQSASLCRTTASRLYTRGLGAQRALRGSKLLRQYPRHMEVCIILWSTSSSTDENIAGYQSNGPQNQSQWAAPAQNHTPNPQWNQPQQQTEGGYYTGIYGNQVLSLAMVCYQVDLVVTGSAELPSATTRPTPSSAPQTIWIRWGSSTTAATGAAAATAAI
jgi:hypothetical protein